MTDNQIPARRVWAVIVNYNGSSLTPQAVKSLQASEHPIERIVVIDNASSDDSLSVLKSVEDDQVHLIANASNVGFARACNQGIRQALEANVDYVFLFNNDARLDGACLGHLIEAAEDRPKAGMIGGKIYYGDSDVIWCAGMDVGFFPNLQKLRGFMAQDEGAFDVIEEVPALTGCGLLLSRAFLEETGGFDESFFVYVEDLELSERGRKMGWQPLYVPHAKIFHDAGSTSGQGYSPWRKYMLAFNLVLFLRKHGTFSLWLAFWLLDVLCWPLVLAAAILTGRARGALAKGRGLAHGLFGMKASPPKIPLA